MSIVFILRVKGMREEIEKGKIVLAGINERRSEYVVILRIILMHSRGKLCHLVRRIVGTTSEKEFRC